MINIYVKMNNEEIEYRKKMYFEGFEAKETYTIEKLVKGKWRFCFGNLTYEEAKFYLSNPELIEQTIKKHQRILICSLVCFIVLLSYFYFTY